MQIWKNNKWILITYCVVILLCISILLSFGKESIHLYINKLNNPSADIFFRYATYLGDGVFVVIVSILLMFWKTRYFALSLAVYLFSGFFVQLFKRLIWYDAKRPLPVIGEEMLHLVNGVHMHSNHSFPSGHSASAFGLFFVLILLVKNNYLKWLFFVLALLTAYSRMYLSQHFLVDVVVGSIIGLVSAFILYNRIINSKAKWLDFVLFKEKER